MNKENAFKVLDRLLSKYFYAPNLLRIEKIKLHKEVPITLENYRLINKCNTLE